jgi:hypothetical protein
MLAVDVGRDPLDSDQLTTELFQTIVIDSKAELDPAIGDAAFGDKAPDDLLEDLLKVHASVPILSRRKPPRERLSLRGAAGDDAISTRGAHFRPEIASLRSQ